VYLASSTIHSEIIMAAAYAPLQPDQQQPWASGQNNNTEDSIRKLIQSLLWFAFEVTVIYALVASNTHAVHIECGSSLWNLIFFELLLNWFEGIVSNVIMTPMMLHRVFQVGSIWNLSFFFLTSSTLILICIHASMLSLGVSIVVPAMSNNACTAALSAASITSTPILGILGFFFIFFDSIALLAFTCVVVGIVC
jgi:hypothetical protein